MTRLDQTLVARGLATSRARARDLIKRGFVRVAGTICDKPSFEVREALAVELEPETPDHVSRGAEKLAAALDRFGFEPTGVVGLDVGASTGGFTQVLLRRGAHRVYAVDVGHGQLHPSIGADGRVVALEGCNARTLSRALIPEPVDAIVADVSFVSLTKVLGPALALAAERAWLVALVKPQFEAGRKHVGSGGIVRDAAAQGRAVEQVSAWIDAQSGWGVEGSMESPISGGSGNREFLIGAQRHV